LEKTWQGTIETIPELNDAENMKFL
jgi:hypothetical protein